MGHYTFSAKCHAASGFADPDAGHQDYIAAQANLTELEKQRQERDRRLYPWPEAQLADFAGSVLRSC